jgi:hypothetical protein
VEKDVQKSADQSYDFAQELTKNKEEIAKKPQKKWDRRYKKARSDVEKHVWVMEYFANNGWIFSTDEVINTLEPFRCSKLEAFTVFKLSNLL